MPFPLDDPAVLDNPFPYFAKCRRESPLVFYEPWNAWFVFKHDDCLALGRDDRLSNRRMDLFIAAAPPDLRGELAFLQNELADMVMMLDGEQHRRVRHVVANGFSLDAVARLKTRIAHHVDVLLGELSADAFDASTGLCRRLPIRVIADMLGVPESDFPRVLHWANSFVDYFNRMPAPREQTLTLVQSGREMLAYTRSLIAERRRRPGDDYLSTLIAGVDGQMLTDNELLANAIVLLIAGNDTVGSALGNAVWLLLTFPETRAKLASRTDWEHAFEEVMRFEPANPMVMRKVAAPIALRGQTIEPGQEVFLMLGSANRDEAVFTDGERFDPARWPNHHAGFGVGSHFCLGAHLARAQAHELLPRLFERRPKLRLDEGKPPVWLRALGVRGPLSLAVRDD